MLEPLLVPVILMPLPLVPLAPLEPADEPVLEPVDEPLVDPVDASMPSPLDAPEPPPLLAPLIPLALASRVEPVEAVPVEAPVDVPEPEPEPLETDPLAEPLEAPVVASPLLLPVPAVSERTPNPLPLQAPAAMPPTRPRRVAARRNVMALASRVRNEEREYPPSLLYQICRSTLLSPPQEKTGKPPKALARVSFFRVLAPRGPDGPAKRLRRYALIRTRRSRCIGSRSSGTAIC
jgi:hypothetical protein